MLPQVPVFNQPEIQPITLTIKVEEPKPEPITYIVVSGDTLTSISEAQGTSVARLWAKNTELTNPDVITPGMALNIPTAEEVLTDRPMPNTIKVSSGQLLTGSSSPHSGGFSSPGNSYSYGFCTFLVKQLRPDIPNGWGNASNWLNAAQRAGYATGSEPRVGAVAWARTYGHVALVIGVSGNQVTVKEENYIGWDKVSTRTTAASEFLYIY